MSVSPVTFVDIVSANVSSLTWSPRDSKPMFYESNLTLLGSSQEFYSTNTTQQVLLSVTANDFFGRSPPNIVYTQAWQSVYTPSGTFTFRSVSTNTMLGQLELYNNQSQLFLAPASGSNTLNNKESLAQFLVNVLNGPSRDPGGGFSSWTCPCQNADIQNAYCALGAWNFIARQIDLTLSNKLTTPMSPCMDPANTMFVSEGIGNIFNITAQIKRIRNLDRVFFRSVEATPKPCNGTVLFQLAALTCGELERDECPFYDSTTVTSCTTGINTRFGLDFSIQATVLGTNLVSSTRLCDNLSAVQKNTDCPLEGGQCMEVFLPLMLVNATLEVPVEPVPSTLPILSATSNAVCQLNSPGASLTSYLCHFERASFSMGLAMSEKPVILYPTETVIIPPDYRSFIETAVMDAANTVLRNNLGSQLTNAFSPFFQRAFAIAPLMDFVPVCLNMSQTTPFMDCPPNTIVVPPTTCDPCDECCLCMTGGDCGEKCRQRCACVNTFCAAVDRIEYPIWWKLVVVIFVLLAVVMVVGGGFMRGIQQ